MSMYSWPVGVADASVDAAVVVATKEVQTGIGTHAVPALPSAAHDEPVLVPAHELPSGVLIVAEPPGRVGKSVSEVILGGADVVPVP